MKIIDEPNGSWVVIWPVTLSCYVLFFWTGVQKRLASRLTALFFGGVAWAVAWYSVLLLALKAVEEGWWTVLFIAIVWIALHLALSLIAAIIFCNLRDD